MTRNEIKRRSTEFEKVSFPIRTGGKAINGVEVVLADGCAAALNLKEI